MIEMPHLWNDGDDLPQVVQSKAVYADAVYAELTLRFSQTEQGCDQRALPCTSPSHNSDLWIMHIEKK